MNSCLNVKINVNTGIKASATILTREVLNVSATSLIPFEVKIDGRNEPLRFLIQSTAPHIKVNGSNVCDVNFSWDSLLDFDGIALFDADSERLLINIK